MENLLIPRREQIRSYAQACGKHNAIGIVTLARRGGRL
jgi:hypothetical protein